MRWYVFDAQAVNFHGFPRATADIDLTIELGDRTLPRVIARLATAGFEPRFRDPDFVAATRVVPVVHRATGIPIDLVLAGPGLEMRFLDEVVAKQIDKYTIPVLSAENLVITKLLAARPKDLEDIRELVALRAEALDHALIEERLRELEAALGQSDLVSTFRRLRSGA